MRLSFVMFRLHQASQLGLNLSAFASDPNPVVLRQVPSLEILYIHLHLAFHNPYLLFRQPIQRIDPLINLLIDLGNLPL